MNWRDSATAVLRNSQNRADHELTKPTKPPFVSVVSSVPPHFPKIEVEPTLEDLASLDGIIRELAEVEDWPEEDLAKALAARKRMAADRVLYVRDALGAAYSDAIGVWPEVPAERPRIALCEF